MTRLDRLLQIWRFSKVRPWLTLGTRVLDIGCANGALFQYYADFDLSGAGLDPELKTDTNLGKITLLARVIDGNLNDLGKFDLICMLAVIEHIPTEKQREMAEQCFALLQPDGKIVITVPSPLVDHILRVLRWLRWVDGMSLEQHYGFEPRNVRPLFEASGFDLVCHRRFQLGLNHLFVFTKSRNSFGTTPT